MLLKKFDKNFIIFENIVPCSEFRQVPGIFAVPCSVSVPVPNPAVPVPIVGPVPRQP